MSLRRRVVVAVVVGVVAELVLFAPLLLISSSFSDYPSFVFVQTLDLLQWPGASLMYHVMRAPSLERMVKHYKIAREVICSLEALVVLTQATIWALLVFGMTGLVKSRAARKLYARPRRALAVGLGPPLFLMLATVALMFPWWVLDEDVAELLLAVSGAWLMIVVVMASAVIVTQRFSVSKAT